MGLRLAKAVGIVSAPNLLPLSRLLFMKSLSKRLGSDSKYERWRWQMFAVTWLGYAGFYLTRKSFSIAKTDRKSVV